MKGEAEGERIPDLPLSAEPDAGLHLMPLRSWPEQKPRVGHSTDWATQAPLVSSLLACF